MFTISFRKYHHKKRKQSVYVNHKNINFISTACAGHVFYQAEETQVLTNQGIFSLGYLLIANINFV